MKSQTAQNSLATLPKIKKILKKSFSAMTNERQSKKMLSFCLLVFCLFTKVASLLHLLLVFRPQLQSFLPSKYIHLHNLSAPPNIHVNSSHLHQGQNQRRDFTNSDIENQKLRSNFGQFRRISAFWGNSVAFTRHQRVQLF